jgi:ribosomal-protein-alanine N-acetyltransferase
MFNLNLCPILYGERVALQPLLAEHADALFPILSDAELWHYAPRPQSKSVDELRARCARLESRRSPDDREHRLNWAIEEEASRSIVGYVQSTVDETLREAIVAYVLGRPSWGRGLASDAVRAMLAHLKTIGVSTFLATVDARNLRSVRLLESFGFRVMDAQDPNNTRYTIAAADLFA